MIVGEHIHVRGRVFYQKINLAPIDNIIKYVLKSWNYKYELNTTLIFVHDYEVMLMPMEAGNAGYVDACQRDSRRSCR